MFKNGNLDSGVGSPWLTNLASLMSHVTRPEIRSTSFSEDKPVNLSDQMLVQIVESFKIPMDVNDKLTEKSQFNQ